MPGFEKRRALNSKPAATSTIERENTAEQTTQGEAETGAFITYVQPNLAKAPRVTPNNILSMQRTIGNQAVQRLIQQQKAITKDQAVPTEISRQPQATMTPAITQANRNPVQTHKSIPAASVAGGFTIQRLSTKKSIKNLSESGVDGDNFKDLMNKLKYYETTLKNNKIDKSQGERQAQYVKLTEQLDDIVQQANKYLNIHENKKTTFLGADRKKTVATLENLVLEVSLEKTDLLTIVNNDDYDKENKETNETWETAINRKQQPIVGKAIKNHKIAKVVNLFGFPIEYVKTLDLETLDCIINVHDFLTNGKVGKADLELVQLNLLIPDTYNLVLSAIMRKNLGVLNPELAEAITNDKFKQKGKNAEVGMEAMGGYDRYFNTYNLNFTDNMNTPEEAVNKYAAKQNHNPNLAADIKGRQEWEKKNVDLKDFQNLENHEKTAISQYSQDYKQFNDPLRGDLTPGEGEKKFNRKKLEKTRNLVSALNKLPAYTKLVYRHDTDFSGFNELNQVGGIVTDMSFTSSTREAYSLKKIEKIPDILNVIQSKTGRFIKPGSFYSRQLEGDENEVLFKPGTQFKVVKRYERNQNGEFPIDMDRELRDALEKDVEKATIRIILKKEEV